jgi:uncharacterized protein YodC (DUF2158 family)
MENIKIGDVVRLMSEELFMTVIGKTSTGKFECAWYYLGEYKHAAFPCEALTTDEKFQKIEIKKIYEKNAKS